jgi:phosphate transport system substrate-binding protein
MIKKFVMALGLICSLSTATQAKQLISGSDTVAGLMTDAIIAAGMQEDIGYVGGGSGVGEKALLNAEIGMTAMSRQIKPEVQEQLRTQGVEVLEYIVALDGLGIFVNSTNSAAGIDLALLAKIFTCEVRNWDQIPGSGKVGQINVYRRNDQSGTTDTFKNLVGVKSFGACVTVVNETIDIAEKTASDVNAVGYAGLSGKKEGNRTLAVAKDTASQYVQPATTTIRNQTYPLARKLFIYSVSGTRAMNNIESQLLEQLTDRSFMDPIVQDHDFITID